MSNEDDDFDFSEVVTPTEEEFAAYRELMRLAVAFPALLMNITRCEPLHGREWRAITEMLHRVMQLTVAADDEGIIEFTPSRMVVTPHSSANAPREQYCSRCRLLVTDQVHDQDDPQPTEVWGPP